MSLVTALRDYVDFINQNYDSMSTHGSLFFLFHHTLLYLFESIKYGLLYLLSLRWLVDLLYLPTLAPQISVAILRENFYPLESPLLNVFSLLEAPSFLHNKFVVGFLNSLFVSLPISAIHLVAGRRLLVEGIPAGVAAGLGTIVGHSFFLASTLFGWRWLIISWFSLEPLNYLLALFVLIQTVYTICHAPSIKIVQWSEKQRLLTCFLMNLCFTWCEQSSLFQYVGNLTMTSEPSFIENVVTPSRLSFLGTHALYLLGFVLGSCCFSLLFAVVALTLKDRWLQWSTMTTSRLVNRLNFCFLVGIVALSFASIPYYGLDYLFTKGLGFIPQDKALVGTMFSPSGMADTSKCIGVSAGFKSLNTDTTPFDGGRYLQASIPQTFEDLNYQGEQYWTGRIDRKMFTTSTGGQKGKAFGNKWIDVFGGRRKEVQLVIDEDSTRRKESTRTEGEGKEVGSSMGDPLPWYREFEESDVLPSSDDEEEMTDFPFDEKNGNFDSEDVEGIDGLSSQPDEDASKKAKAGTPESGDFLFNLFFNLVDPGLSPLFLSETPEPSNLEKFLKNKFYRNPVFHLLLKIDIDTFLARQPACHSLTPEQEVDLFRRRQLLANYYDTLLDYLELQRDEASNDLGEKGGRFPDHVYNHQFKGTLKVVRRLFSITLDPDDNWAEERVLKFDQPLFHALQGERHPLVHEELSDGGSDLSPFIEMTHSRPFYAGWDEQLRRLVITTRYLPRYFSTHRIRIPVSTSTKEGGGDGVKQYLPLTRRLELAPRGANNSRRHPGKGEKNPLLTSSRKLLFTAWPLPKQMAEAHAADSTTLASAVNGKLVERFEIFSLPESEYDEWEIESWPENLAVDWMERRIIPPTRGGFVWPGSSEFPFDVRKFIPDVKKWFFDEILRPLPSSPKG